jgi:xanthine phosphoribosyltransferase
VENDDDRYKRNFPISWEQLHRDARALAWRLHDMNMSWEKMVAVTRGGLVPAAIVARELSILNIDTVCVTTYDWQRQGGTTILKPVAGDGKGCLVIDDLVDTGATAKVIRNMLPAAFFATVYAKPAGKPLVDAYVTEVSQDTWILFPWDSETRFVKPIACPDKGSVKERTI